MVKGNSRNLGDWGQMKNNIFFPRIKFGFHLLLANMFLNSNLKKVMLEYRYKISPLGGVEHLNYSVWCFFFFSQSFFFAHFYEKCTKCRGHCIFSLFLLLNHRGWITFNFPCNSAFKCWWQLFGLEPQKPHVLLKSHSRTKGQQMMCWERKWFCCFGWLFTLDVSGKFV